MAEATRKPWWAVALLTGVGVGIGLATGLGIASTQGEARAQTKAAAVVAQPAPVPDPEWRSRIETKLNEVAERLARIEGRLERK